jgi:hypothetical protein
MDGYDRELGGRGWERGTRPAGGGERMRMPRGGWRGDARHFGGGPYDVGFGGDPGPRRGGGWDRGLGYGGFAPGDRGLYGEAYPGPADPAGMRGVTFGADEGIGPQPAADGWADRGFRGRPAAFGRGYDPPFRGPARGYDGAFARADAPFVPDWFYREHTEYRNAPHHPTDRWEAGFGGRGAVLEDDEVQERVRDRLTRDEWVDEARVFVDVEDGVVTLSGEVDDFMEARYAWDDAWETDGVRGVVNQLTVRTDVPQPRPHGDVLPQG